MAKKTRSLVISALLAALYVALTYLQGILLPGTTSMAVQFRASEALCVFAFFTPAAIPGLAAGCLLYNISNAGALPLDWLVGTLATAASCAAMWKLRGVKLKSLPLAGLLMPAALNALLVGWELAVYVCGGFTLPVFLFQALCVFAGEAAVLLTLGSLMYYLITSRGLDKRL